MKSVHPGSCIREASRGELTGKRARGHVGLRLPGRSLIFILQAVEPLLSYRGGLQSDLHFRNLILAIWVVIMGTEKQTREAVTGVIQKKYRDHEPEQ